MDEVPVNFDMPSSRTVNLKGAKKVSVATVNENAAVNENCVRNGFIKAQGDEAVSDDSDDVHDDTFLEMEAEELPKEILNVIDSFNVESNEEFLGFE
jgi:hypothetical protein